MPRYTTAPVFAALAAIAAGASIVHAQSAPAPIFGIHAGLSYSTISGNDVGNTSYRTGFAVGGYIEQKLNDMWSFQPEIQYIQKGVKFSEGNPGSGSTFSAEVKLSYVEIPLMLRVSGSRSSSGIVPFAQLGPALSFKAGCDVAATSGATSLTSACSSVDLDASSFDASSFDYGAIGGVGVDVTIGGHVYSAVARYNLGLKDISSDGEGKNRSFTALIGIRF